MSSTRVGDSGRSKTRAPAKARPPHAQNIFWRSWRLHAMDPNFVVMYQKDERLRGISVSNALSEHSILGEGPCKDLQASLRTPVKI